MAATNVTCAKPSTGIGLPDTASDTPAAWAVAANAAVAPAATAPARRPVRAILGRWVDPTVRGCAVEVSVVAVIGMLPSCPPARCRLHSCYERETAERTPAARFFAARSAGPTSRLEHFL